MGRILFLSSLIYGSVIYHRYRRSRRRKYEDTSDDLPQAPPPTYDGPSELGSDRTGRSSYVTKAELESQEKTHNPHRPLQELDSLDPDAVAQCKGEAKPGGKLASFYGFPMRNQSRIYEMGSGRSVKSKKSTKSIERKAVDPSRKNACLPPTPSSREQRSDTGSITDATFSDSEGHTTASGTLVSAMSPPGSGRWR